MGDLRDVEQAVGVREDLDEGPEVGDALDGAGVRRADLGLGREAADDVERLLHGLRIRRGHVDRAVVLDVDGDARLIDDALDRLAAGPDDQADLIGLDLEGRDARRVLRHLGAGARERLQHLAEDVQAALARLVERLVEDRPREAGDLDVHLDRRHAARGAADLEVHVAEVVLVAEDVGEDGVLVALLDQAHRDAGDGALDRHARVHQREAAAADRGHRRGAVGLQRLADDADGVGELVGGRDHPHERALGEGAVPDLAAAGAAHRLGLAGREGGEVVVEVEALPRLAHQAVDLLLVGRGAERRRHDRLRLAALEEGAPVNAREEAGLAHDRAHGLAVAAVDALALFEHHGADDRGFTVLELGLDQLLVGQVFLGADLGAERLGELLLEDGVALVAGLLVEHARGDLEVGVGERGDARLDRGVELGGLEDLLGLADGGAELLDQIEDRLRGLVGEHQGVDEVGLGGLGGAALDHHDGLARAGDDEIEIALEQLGDGREDDELAVLARDADADDRAVPGDVGDVERGRGAGEGEDVGLVLLVAGEHRRDDLRVLLEPVGEERAQRPIHDPAGEDLLVALAGLALEEAAGDLAGRVRLLDELAGEGEEVEAGALVLRDGGHQDHRLAERDEDRPVGLLGESARLEGEGSAADHDGFTYEHGCALRRSLRATDTPSTGRLFFLDSWAPAAGSAGWCARSEDEDARRALGKRAGRPRRRGDFTAAHL